MVVVDDIEYYGRRVSGGIILGLLGEEKQFSNAKKAVVRLWCRSS